MKSRITHLFAAIIVSLSLASLANAAVIDQVQNTVDQIKNQTTTIKNTSADIKQLSLESGSTLSTLVVETVDVKALIQDPMETIQDLLTLFDALGLDPNELANLAGLPEAIVKLKKKQQALIAMQNDPDLETFRTEFMAFLVQIDLLISKSPGEHDGDLQMLIDVVAVAPDLVIGMLKSAMGIRWDELQEMVSELTEKTQRLEASGYFEVYEDIQQMREAAQSEQADRQFQLATEARAEFRNVIIDLQVARLKAPSTPIDLAAWGWVGSEIDPGEESADALEMMIFKLQRRCVDIEMKIQQTMYALQSS